MRSRIVGVCGILAISCLMGLAADEPTFEQRAQMKRIGRDLDQTQKSLDADNASEAARYWLRAHKTVQEFLATADAQQLQSASDHLIRLASLRKLVISGGVALPDLPIIAAAQRARLEVATAGPTRNSSELNFAKDVAPILVEKCGRCHIDATRGKISMATIDSLASNAELIVGGKPDESQLIAVIESGEMPKGRNKVTSTELQTLRTWIQEGASFDDAARQTNLKKLVGQDASPEPAAMAPSTEEAGEKSVVSFANDVAPVLVDQCADCHMDSQRVRGGLNLSTFESLMRGGDNGAIIRANQGEESLLVKKLRGTGGGQQMPAGGNPLSEEVIQLIARWIDQGARMDGNANSNLRDIIARAASAKATHEELSKQRAERAAANWELVMDGKTPVVHQTKNLIVLAPDESGKPDQFAEIAESVIDRVATQLRVADKDPLVKGKIAAYLFSTRYDYGEFGKMIDKRDIPKEWTNHWGNDQVDAFIVFQIPASDYNGVRPWIARNVAAAHIRGLSADVPNWFANGWGYWIAAKIYPGEDVTKLWTQRAGDLTKRMTSRDDFVQGRMSDDDAGLVAFQFVEYLKQGDSKRFNKLVSEMRGGASFERSFALAYDMTPVEMLTQK